MILILLAVFSIAPITSSCLFSLMYSIYLFIAYEESGVHHAQEFENRFWTILAVLLSTVLFFAADSPIAFGLWNPTLGFLGIFVSGYSMHLWDRYVHRVSISQLHIIGGSGLKRSGSSTSSSLMRLRDLGIPVEDQLARINACLRDIDQLLIPSTINNFINQRFVFSKEREIISIFEECDARALNYLISHVKLGLLFYKIKDHRNFNGKHRTALINLLAVERLSILTVVSRVIVLHSLQVLRLRANPQAELWVRNILLNTHQDDLSELKTLTDAKGDYFCMNKLLYDDIKSEAVRQDILAHVRREAAVQQTHIQMGTRRSKKRFLMQFRKVLSDVDDTLTCSGGMYPAGVDKRFPKKTVYPGVLAFYRELDLGTMGPEEWQEDHVGNLVFLSARPHLYKDVSEKQNFAKFERLRKQGADGRKGMHTVPSLLAGDLASGTSYMVTNDFEPLAQKKFDNFRQYVSIYPEYQHVFVCDNGQGDVRAGELMFDRFPYEFEALYVHVVLPVDQTFGYFPRRWQTKEFKPFFFRTYPEAALHAASRKPPLIRVEGLQRICRDAVKDFEQIKNWPSELLKADRRLELNQAVWRANEFLGWSYEDPVDLIKAEQLFATGDKVRTPYGIATILGFDADFDLYDIELDWRPIDVQVKEHELDPGKEKRSAGRSQSSKAPSVSRASVSRLSTVMESDEVDEERYESPPTTPHRTQSGGQSSSEHAEPTQVDLFTTPRQLSVDLRLEAPGATNVGNEHAQVGKANEESSFKRKRVRARVGGRYITDYTPPVLPRIDKKSSLLTFFSPTPESPLQEGAKCRTPYGPGKVIAHRKNENIVVVDLVGWQAKGYIRVEDVEVISKGIFQTLFRQLSISETSQPKSADAVLTEGSQVVTPFGSGTVFRSPPTSSKDQTLGITLDSWGLANGRHPSLYCTVETVDEWKKNKATGNTSIFSALGTLMTSSRTLLEPFLSQKSTAPSKPKFTQYYKESATVTTPFGDGRVSRFREEDGAYEILLLGWPLANGRYASGVFNPESITYKLSRGCKEGFPVLTSLGLSGTLASVDPTTGVHIVTIPSAGAVCYLQPRCIVTPLKAAVGEEVETPIGEGRVTAYNAKDDTYQVSMNGWKANLFAKAGSLDRAGDGVQDRDGPFGVNWLLRLLFFSPGSRTASRSRSNSIVSGSQSSVTKVD